MDTTGIVSSKEIEKQPYTVLLPEPPPSILCWRQFHVLKDIEWIVLKLCDGSEVRIKRVNHIAYVPVEGLFNQFYPGPTALVPLPPEGHDIANRPASPESEPPAAPTPANSSKNCHAVSLGLCPPFQLPAGTPPPPGPLPPPPGGSVHPGGGFWVEDTAKKAFSGSPGYEIFECPPNPPEGTIVTLMCAVSDPDGDPGPNGEPPVEPGTVKAIHSATSNGPDDNGNTRYTSKNGAKPKNDNATEAEAFTDDYPSGEAEGKVYYRVCSKKVSNDDED